MTILFQRADLPVDIPEPDTIGAMRQFKEYAEKHPKKEKKNTFFVPRFLYGGVAAVLLLLIGIFALYKTNLSNSTVVLSAENQMQIFTIDHVADVQLEAGSQMVYREKKRNEIELVGKAAFAVISSDNEEKLTIFAGETRIQDIGTVFTVSAIEGEPVCVEVTEGEVLFYTDHNPGITILANEKGVYDPQSKQFTLIKADYYPSDSKEITEEKEMEEEITIVEEADGKSIETDQKSPIEKSTDLQEITFRSVALKEVIGKLQNDFDANITFSDPAIGELIITTGFMPDDNIDNILLVISKTLSLQITKDGKNYILSH